MPKDSSLAVFGRIDLFVHGSTIATDTVIERNGPKTALLCTEGFATIYFRDGYKPERYNLNMAPPADFVPRHLRMPVRERIDYKGNALIPLDDSSVVEAARALEREHVKAVAVWLLWSINPAHERQVKTILERELPGVPVVLSSDVLPAIRERSARAPRCSAPTSFPASRTTCRNSRTFCAPTACGVICFSSSSTADARPSTRFCASPSMRWPPGRRRGPRPRSTAPGTRACPTSSRSTWAVPASRSVSSPRARRR